MSTSASLIISWGVQTIISNIGVYQKYFHEWFSISSNPSSLKTKWTPKHKLPLFHFPTPPPHWTSSSRQALVGRWNYFHPRRSRTLASKFKSGEYNDKEEYYDDGRDFSHCRKPWMPPLCPPPGSGHEPVPWSLVIIQRKIKCSMRDWNMLIVSEDAACTPLSSSSAETQGSRSFRYHLCPPH